jgi:hypothetical protein
MVASGQVSALALYKKRKMVVIPLNGKRPFFKNWTQLDHIPDDYSVFDNRNMGILTGKASKITVLDIDVQNGGMVHWNKIKKMYPAIVTPMVKTPSKGLHIYFQYNPRLRSTSKIKLDNKSIGWDVLNNGRQVVAPPSKGYKWMLSIEETPLAKMPEWLEIYIKMLAAQS